jgi:hypothetical protein
MTQITFNRPLRYFALQNASGVMCFSSTEGLLHEIHQRSGCKMPGHLTKAPYEA